MKTKVAFTTVFILTVLTALAWQANIAESQRLVTEGLVSYWSFDKASITGQTVKDLWGKNDGTIAGKVEIVQGKIGECLKFDGKDKDKVNCGKDKSLDITKAITTEAWIKRDVLHQRQEILGKICDPGGYEFWISGDNLVTSFIADDKQVRWKAANGTLDTDWHHLVMTFDGKVVTLYIDGKFDVDMPDAFVMGIDPTVDLIMGDHSCPPFKGNWPFIGLMDEVRIYNRALSKDEVQQNFAVEVTAVDPAKKSALTWGEIKVSR